MFTLVDALRSGEAIAGSPGVQNASVCVECKPPHSSCKSIVIHMLLAFPRGTIIHMV
jgi:hypothetical protein